LFYISDLISEAKDIHNNLIIPTALLNIVIFNIFGLHLFCSTSAQSVQNFGLAVITLLAGRIVDSGGYLLLEVFFLGWLCCMY
jgi:hypothetical protein